MDWRGTLVACCEKRAKEIVAAAGTGCSIGEEQRAGEVVLELLNCFALP
jgi:hypothetical protein